jgi:cytoskeletal protein RodZ
MSEEADQAEGQLPLEGAGQRLRRAREEAGKSIEDIAAETRIPIRHLQVIDAGNFSVLPARTYAIGFSRTYARAVGLDEQEIAEQVRAELADGQYETVQHAARFEPGDPARVPSRGLAWFSAFAVLLLVIGALAFFRSSIFPGSGPGTIVPPEEPAETAPAADSAPAPSIAVADPRGQVVFTSTEDGVWVKFYDASGERLMEKQMSQGERYAVPSNAEGPQVWTGQPEALQISIGGKDIGRLSLESEIVRDIPVTAGALAERVAANQAAARAAASPDTAGPGAGRP